MKGRLTSRSKSGITLLELVVVLAIIAVLVGMMLPGFARTKARINYVRCSSNLKQIGLAFRGFAQDWDGVYPFQAKGVTNYIGTPEGGTMVTSNTNPADVWMHFQMISNELNTSKVLVCPQDRARWNTVAEDFSSNTESRDHPRGFAAPTARNKALSYFYGINAVETRPDGLLAGDANLAPSATQLPYSSIRYGGAVRVRPTDRWSELPGYQMHTNWVNLLFADGGVRQSRDVDMQRSLQDAEAKYGADANLLLFPQ